MPQPHFLDAHTHVQFSGYDADRGAVIQRALDAGVRKMIVIGTQKDTSRMALVLAEKYPGDVRAAIGLHPVHTSRSFHDAQELGGGEAAQAFTSRGEVFDADYYRALALIRGRSRSANAAWIIFTSTTTSRARCR